MTAPAGWLPRGVDAGQAWTCTLTLTDPVTGRPRTVYRCFAEIGRPLRFGGHTQLVRFDDSARPERGGAHPAGQPANQVVLTLPESLSELLPPVEDAELEVWIQPTAEAEPYCLLRTPFPIRAKVADLP